MQRNSSFYWHADSFLSDTEDESTYGGVGFSLQDEDEEKGEHVEGREGDKGPPHVVIDITDHSPLLSPEEENYGTASPKRRPPERHVSFAPSIQSEGDSKNESPPQPLTHVLPRGHRFAVDGVKAGSIRFQVVVWYIGAVDVVLGVVPVRFRATIFWNDPNSTKLKHGGTGSSVSETWAMDGRMRAYKEESAWATKATVDVPPISILNAVNYENIGAPEVTMMKEETRLMRWTCMYSALLHQGKNLRVDKFPHDRHDLVLKLGVLAHRRPGGRWDKNKWILDLATEEDSQGSTRIPHGLLVDHVCIPDFKYSSDGLTFEFVPLPLGSGEKQRTKDMCLQVKLRVSRESRHYDRNIVPLLILLNVVAISCLPRTFDSATASTETMLGIAFVEIGIRLTVDSRLPSVGYQIKMQRTLNQCFWLLCYLVMETNFVFFLVKKAGWSESTTNWIDVVAALVALLYTAEITAYYYCDFGSSKPNSETGKGGQPKNLSPVDSFSS